MQVMAPAAANSVDSVLVIDDVMNENEVIVSVVLTTEVKPPKNRRPSHWLKEGSSGSPCDELISGVTISSAVALIAILNSIYML